LLFPVLLSALTASLPPLLQGTLLFCLLLLAIWAPLLLFSSGAPTYQTPGIVDVRANASFGVTTSYGHYQGASVTASNLYLKSSNCQFGYALVTLCVGCPSAH
jgi:hypothetical protein